MDMDMSSQVNDKIDELTDIAFRECDNSKLKGIKNKVYNLYMQNKDLEIVVLSYLDFLYLLFEKEIDAAKIIVEAEKVYKQHKKSEKVAGRYFDFLTRSLIEGFEIPKILEKGEKVYKQYFNSTEILEHYFEFLLLFIYNKSDVSNLAIEKGEIVFKDHPTSEAVAVAYLNFLSEACQVIEDSSLIREIINQGEKAYSSHNTSNSVILSYLNLLTKLVQTDYEDLALNKGEKVYQHPHIAEAVAIAYYDFLLNFSYLFVEESIISKLIRQGEEVYRSNRTSEEVVVKYLNFLFKLSIDNLYMSSLEEIYRKGKEVKNQVSYSPRLALACLNFILKMNDKESKEINIQEIIHEAEGIYSSFNSPSNNKYSEDVCTEYVRVLYNVSFYQGNKREIKDTAMKIEEVFNLFSDSEVIAFMYISILRRLSEKYQTLSRLKEISERAKRIVEKNNKNIIYINYIRILYNLSLKQKRVVELEETVYEAKNIYNNYQFINTASYYEQILLNWALNQNDILKIDEITEEIINLCNKSKLLKNKIEISMDLFLMSKKISKKHLRNFSRVLYNFFEYDKNDNPLWQTKYQGLLNLMGNKSSEELDILINIFRLVQIIKNQLIVKEPDNLTFGHYTSGKVLQIYLKQNEDDKEDKAKEKYSITTKSRLSNVNYMNDPSEGKVLDQFLHLELPFQKVSLKPSPWFLMCLTTAIDRLEMWAQYGDRAKGVCLVLNNGNFSKVYHSSDVPTFKNSEEISDETLENGSLEKKQELKDFIYRICYLSNPEITDTLVEKAYNKSLDKDEIEVINTSLMSLKSIVKNINQNSILYEVVDECLEEIRYLFKLADYSYECELRLLKYSPLESDNKNIKIDDSGDIAKLYIERDNPIQIDEVIFGPKFSHPENVTPLLHLLDNNIKFSQSKIPFK